GSDGDRQIRRKAGTHRAVKSRRSYSDYRKWNRIYVHRLAQHVPSQSESSLPVIVAYDGDWLGRRSIILLVEHPPHQRPPPAAVEVSSRNNLTTRDFGLSVGGHIDFTERRIREQVAEGLVLARHQLKLEKRE